MHRAGVRYSLLTSRARQLLALVAAAASLSVPAAGWASPDAVVRDCASDGSLDGDYSDADKRAALGQLGAELREYSDCENVIAASIGGPGGAVSSSSQDGDGATGTPSNRTGARSQDGGRATRASRRKSARDAAHGRKASSRGRKRRAVEAALGAGATEPHEPATLASGDDANAFSTPLLLALIALGALGAGGALLALGKRNPRLAEGVRRVSFRRFRR